LIKALSREVDSLDSECYSSFFRSSLTAVKKGKFIPGIQESESIKGREQYLPDVSVGLPSYADSGWQTGIAHGLGIRYVISTAFVDEVVESLWRNTSWTWFLMPAVLFHPSKVLFEFHVLLLLNTMFAFDCWRMLTPPLHERFPRKTVDTFGVGGMITFIEHHLRRLISKLSTGLPLTKFTLELFLAELLTETVDAASSLVMVAFGGQVLVFHRVFCIILEKQKCTEKGNACTRPSVCATSCS
jgi:hypothetical protein